MLTTYQPADILLYMVATFAPMDTKRKENKPMDNQTTNYVIAGADIIEYEQRMTEKLGESTDWEASYISLCHRMANVINGEMSHEMFIDMVRNDMQARYCSKAKKCILYRVEPYLQ